MCAHHRAHLSSSPPSPDYVRSGLKTAIDQPLVVILRTSRDARWAGVAGLRWYFVMCRVGAVNGGSCRRAATAPDDDEVEVKAQTVETAGPFWLVAPQRDLPAAGWGERSWDCAQWRFLTARALGRSSPESRHRRLVEFPARSIFLLSSKQPWC